MVKGEHEDNMTTRTVWLGLGALAMMMLTAVIRTEGGDDGWRIRQVATNASVTCRRPCAPGLYDPQVNRTFACWSGPSMDPYVCSMDHGSGEITVVRVGGRGNEDDFHDYPHLVQSADGFLHVFYSTHNRKLWQITSSKPRSVEGPWRERELTDSGASIPATYPMPIATGQGKLYVFYRATLGADNRPIFYLVSRNNGRTWGEARPIIDYQDQRPDHLNEIYVGAIVGRPGADGSAHRVLFSWTLAGGGPTQRRHDIYHKDVYFAVLDTGADRLRSADGTDLGPFVDSSEAAAHCMLYDSGSLDDPVKHPGFRERPQHIGYITVAHEAPGRGAPVVAFQERKQGFLGISRWDGEAWQLTKLPLAGVADMGVSPSGELRLFVSRGGRMRVLSSADGGGTWAESPQPVADVGLSDFNLIDDGHTDFLAIARQGKRIVAIGAP